MKKLIIKALKIIGMLALLSIIVIGGIIGFNYYSDKKRDLEELQFRTTKEWKWHDNYDRVQISFNEELRTSVLRKVSSTRDYVIYVYMNNDLSLSALVQFIHKCEPNTEIKTTKKFSDGTPKTLTCNESGDFLTYSVQWSKGTKDITWSEDLDGFSLYEKFSYWDFSELEREITLLKAKKRASN